MKHRFLLDENILYFAILGIDEHDRENSTSTQLVQLIGANCHRIIVNSVLLDRYHRHILMISRRPSRPYALEPVSFINDLLRNSEKLTPRYEVCPEIPAGVVLPTEDDHIIRLAMLAGATIVTGDADLRAALRRETRLGVTALTPIEALEPASDS